MQVEKNVATWIQTFSIFGLFNQNKKALSDVAKALVYFIEQIKCFYHESRKNRNYSSQGSFYTFNFIESYANI